MDGNDPISDYIAQAARARNIDPSVALAVAQSEGLRSYVGDQGSSFGPFQLHYGGFASGGNAVSGLGDQFTAQTGLDARDPNTVYDQIDFALDHAAQHGWGAWHGWKGNPMAGISANSQPQQTAQIDFFKEAQKLQPATAGASAPSQSAAPSSDGNIDFFQEAQKLQPSVAASAQARAAAPATAPAEVTPLQSEIAPLRAMATGIPVLGGLLNKADAATNALLAPVLNPLFPQNEQLQGATWSDRYRNALAIQQGMDTAFQKAHPVASPALNIAGGVLGTIPAAVAAPEALGIGEGNLLLRSLTSGAAGGLVNAADTATRAYGSIPEWTNPNINLPALENSAVIGFGTGALAPSAGELFGKSIGALSNALFRTTPAARNIASVLSDIGLTPAETQNALLRMGPNATLADIDPALRMEAGGLAATGGAPTSILKSAMLDRAAQADDSASRLMNAQLGPSVDPEATIQGIKEDAAKRAGPYYEAGKAGAPMDVTPVLNSINQQLPNASGGIKSILSSVKGFLTNEVASKSNPLGMIVPKSDPEAILGARQALDDMMYNRDMGDAKLGPNAMRIAGNLRGQIDDIVKQNGSFAAGDAIYSQAKGIESAFRQGQDIFNTNMRPADLQGLLSSMTPEEQASLKMGARSAITDAMQASRRGEGPAAQGLFARATNNRANLNILFPNGQDALDALHAEATMRQTEQEVARNSATAAREAIKAKYAPQAGPSLGAAPAVIGEALGGGAGAVAATGAKAVLGHASNALTHAALNRLKLETAKGLVAIGPEQNAFLGQVGREQGSNALTNALTRGGSTAVNLLSRAAGNALLDRRRSMATNGP